MNVIGYSERGIMNALFYELAGAANASAMLRALLVQASFPFTQSRPIQGEAEILIEQSFSDFGDADAVVLMQATEGHTCSIFIEAKVKTFKVADWQIVNEFTAFREGLDQQKVASSNLFTQLHHKVRLISGLRQGGIPLLQQGLSFPTWSSKQIRRIGTNEVVLKATRRLETHLGEVFYLAIIPDLPGRVDAFLDRLQAVPHCTLKQTWDVSTYGFLTWSQVREYCVQTGLTRTLAVFDYNAGQIDRVSRPNDMPAQTSQGT